MGYEKLFTPFRVGNMVVKNRIGMSPMGTNSAFANGRKDAQEIDYFIERAKGGAGIIFMGCQMLNERLAQGSMEGYLDSYTVLPSLTSVVDGCHRYGAKIVCQISPGTGRNAFPDTLGNPPISSSDTPSVFDPNMKCHALTKDEIADIMEDFKFAAGIARDAGFDAVQFQSFMDYAAQHNVKVIVWCNALSDFANGNADILRSKLEMWASYGVAGIKIDFFDGQNATNPKHQGEDIDTIKWYETIYQECAKRKMVVNAHGSNKPTGERRKYPNVINREGIYGNEFAAVDSTVTVNHLFTRAILGASDFTPVVNPRNEGLTVAHQMALAVLFESVLPSMADFAEVYYDDTIMDFYKAIPSIRDEIVFLGGEPDYYYCAAIKAGDDWFVACVNSVSKSKVEIDFSFLGAGNYITDFYTDSEDGVVKTQKEISSSSKESVNVERNSGFIYHIRKQA